ncbi:MAG: FAD-dependent oxidoreductase [Rhodospirillales bacterium]|nr:FAD-dependent oxidoreductase [Rhodospirillales bacterium]
MPVLGGKRGRVVVLGGGAGGAVAARRLAREFTNIDVTLIEANRNYQACFYSNRYVGGLRSLDAVTHGYEALALSGITVVHARAVAVDGSKKAVALAGGDRIAYDRLIMSPGVDFKFDTINGYDEKAAAIIPHAYKADAQVAVLKRQLDAMKDGGLFVISAPRRPYRCPPAPYERAAMVAHYFKNHKPRSKILILDSKDEYPLSEALSPLWERFYPGMVEWVPAEFGGHVQAVDVKSRTLITSEEKYKADVANIIPDQHAADIARQSGLADASGWCPVDANTFESTLIPGIHLIGDAIDGGDMSKSAFSTASQGRACAAAVGAALTGGAAKDSRLANTCYFLIAPGHGLKLGGTYKATNEGITGLTGFASGPGEDDALRKTIANEGDAWYTAAIREMFGK